MGEKHLGRSGSMFGMDDPGQVLPQIKRYVEDGRLEISEVMAVELVSKLRAEKKGTIAKINAEEGESLAVDAVILELE